MTVHWDYRRGTYSARLMTELAAQHGVSLGLCLQGTGITAEALDDPDAEITGRQELQLVANIVEALPGVPEIGLESGTRYHLTAYGIWGYAVMSSQTVRDAVELGLRYLNLTYAFSRFDVEEDEGRVLMVLDDEGIPGPARRALVERDLSAVYHMCCQLLGEAPPLVGLELRFEEPPYAARYEELVGVRPVFGAARNVMEYDASLLDRLLPQANLHTAKLSEGLCEELLAARQAREGTAGAVRHLLLSRPGHAPDMERIARDLGTTSRTLRRRLDEEGTSFRVLVDEVRESLAEQLLSTAGLSVDAVAKRLGFANTAGFVSAFKRWKGVPPGAWRAGRHVGRRSLQG
jgi:AraC-like DNA-binding protein